MKIVRAGQIVALPKRGGAWPMVTHTAEGPFIIKWKGSGHGAKALIAEIIVNRLAKVMGLQVPELLLLDLHGDEVCDNRDPELLELLAASRGLNLGVHFIEKARDFTRSDLNLISADEAAKILWLDALVMNADRTLSNPNLLMKNGKVWLIDHGSSLPFHHDWSSVTEDSPRRMWFNPRHLFSSYQEMSATMHPALASSFSFNIILHAVEGVPDQFMETTCPDGDVTRRKMAFAAFLWKRLRYAQPANYFAKFNFLEMTFSPDASL